MLILTRRIDESIKIDDNITITVLGIKGNQVRIGIEAPADVKILRSELQDRVEKASGKDAFFRIANI